MEHESVCAGTSKSENEDFNSPNGKGELDA